MLSDIKAPDGAAKYSIRMISINSKRSKKGNAGLRCRSFHRDGKGARVPSIPRGIDGHSTVSPHMMKIKHTQLGYGVDYARSSRGTAGYGH